MNLSDYIKLCARLEAYCTRARESGHFDGSDALEHELRRFYYAEKDYNELSHDCQQLAKTPGQKRTIKQYRQQLAVYASISALIADLEAGAITCPESTKGLKIHALRRLYEYSSELSAICLAEFDKKDSGDQLTVPEAIARNPRALALAQALQDAGYLDEEYRFIFIRRIQTQCEGGRAGQKLAEILGAGITHEDFESYWGMKKGYIRMYAGNPKGNTRKIDEIMRKALENYESTKK